MAETSIKFKVVISSVIKGRHASKLRTSMGYMRVISEPNNPYDVHAFKVVNYKENIYGRVPQTIKEIFFQLDVCANEKKFQYEIICEPTVLEDIPCLGGRWSRGGGLEQPCQYQVKGNSAALDYLVHRLKEQHVPYKMEAL